MTSGPSPRPVRRAPSEFSLSIERTHLARRVASAPDWLIADRSAGFDAFEALPPETNLLYTTYLDLRPADLAEATVVEAVDGTGATAAATLPDGVRRAQIAVNLATGDESDIKPGDVTLANADGTAGAARSSSCRQTPMPGDSPCCSRLPTR